MAITRAQQARQMLKDGNFVMQGGVKNYLGKQETVSNVPVKWQSGPDKPSTELAYITKAEKDLLLKKDIHGSLKDGPNTGPGGLMSLDSAGSGFGGPGPGKSSSSGGGNDRNDPPSDFRSSNVMNPTTKTAREKFERTGERVKSLTDTGGFTGGYGGSGGSDDPDDQPAKDLEEFYDKPGKYPKYTPAYLKFLGNLNRRPNREFFVNRVLRAGKIPGLEYKDIFDEDFDIEEAYQDYMDNRMAGKTDAIGNPVSGFEYSDDGTLTGNFIDDRDDGANQPIFPLIPDDINQTAKTEDDPTNIFAKAGITPRIAGSIFAAEGGRIGAAEGGIMDLETGRQMYFLGKLVKKATRAVKKIAKSPIGKAALLYGGAAMAGSFGAGKGLFSKGMFNPGNIGRGLFGITAKGQAARGFPELAAKKGLFGKLGLTEGYGALMPTIKGGITLASILPLLVGKTEEEKKNILDEYYASQQLTPSQSVRGVGSEMDFYNYNIPLAEGGMPSKEPVAKKTMPLLDMDGKEMDLRAEGGFVPIGRMEKADDVPARLSKNEFVFTADAVRNAGDGDVDKGAEVMYNMMKNLESGGDVSEESQGLEGAREMFQTSKRLEEVL